MPNQEPLQTFQELQKESEDFRRRVITSIGWSLGLLSLIAGPIRHAIVPLLPATIMSLAIIALFLFSLPFFIRRGYSTRFCGTILLLCCSGIGLAAGFSNGGVRAPASIILILNPMVGFFCMGNWGALMGLAFSTLTLLVLLFAEQFDLIVPLHQSGRYPHYLVFIYFIASVISYLIGAAYERSRRISDEIVKKLSAAATHSAKMASLGEMSAGVAHEINNPVSIILLALDSIERNKDQPEKVAQKLEAISKASHRITKIVNGLKKFSRSGEKLPFEIHSLNQITKEVISMVAPKAKLHTTEISLEGNASSSIECNETEIQQVLINLIDNAIDATKDQKEKWVRVSISEEEQYILIHIMDSGPGISPEHQKKIFDPFFTTKPPGQGTGLGLSIAKGILDDHRAQFSVRTISGHTCFEIKFPKSLLPSKAPH